MVLNVTRKQIVTNKQSKFWCSTQTIANNLENDINLMIVTNTQRNVFNWNCLEDLENHILMNRKGSDSGSLSLSSCSSPFNYYIYVWILLSLEYCIQFCFVALVYEVKLKIGVVYIEEKHEFILSWFHFSWLCRNGNLYHWLLVNSHKEINII